MFAPVDWSVFSDDFSLDPYPYVEPLYDRQEILGFRSEGLDFIFRHEDVAHFLHNRHLNQDRFMEELSFHGLETEELHPNSLWYRKFLVTAPENARLKSENAALRDEIASRHLHRAVQDLPT